MPYKRRKYHQGITTEKKKYRTKRRKRDIDQIFEDLEEPAKRAKLENQAVDPDLPGAGQFYCIHCAKHCIDNHALEEHCRGKVHKKRVRDLKEVPYSIKESELAAGLGSYVKPVVVDKTEEEVKVME